VSEHNKIRVQHTFCVFFSILCSFIPSSPIIETSLALHKHNLFFFFIPEKRGGVMWWFPFFSSGISAFVSCFLLYLSGSFYSSPLVFFFNTSSFLVLEVFSVVSLKGTKGYQRIIGIVLR
jgi:hypothetical protein